MELLQDLNTAGRIAWGLVSFIVLIVWLRWEGPVDDQRKDERSEVRKRKAGNVD